MSRNANYAKLYEKDYQSLYEKYEASQKELKELRLDNKELKAMNSTLLEIKTTLKELKQINQELNEKVEFQNKLIQEKDGIIKKQSEEIQRLKNNNKKDSSNSSKPSSSNGSKIIPNTRTKSNKKPGGQLFHAAHTLKAKDVESILNDEKIKDRIKHTKKILNENSNKAPKYILDLLCQIVVNENSCDDFDKLNDVQYGTNIKALVVYLYSSCTMSYDQIIELIKVLTENKLQLSKGTLRNWTNKFTNKLEDNELKVIEKDLLDGYSINADDSNFKINGNNYYQLCLCNKTTVLLYSSESKSYEAWKKTILSKFIGVIVKDGTKVYNKFNQEMSQCISHIIRYLKCAYEFSNNKHIIPKNLMNFFKSLNIYRNKLISQGIESLDDDKLDKFEKIYDNFMDSWGKELENESNIIYDEEIKLHNRMKNKEKKQILYFLKDFKIPFTNNMAEANQRPLKIKQKIGKFRSDDGAVDYCKTKSFILTVRKRKLSIFKSICNVLNNKPVLE